MLGPPCSALHPHRGPASGSFHSSCPTTIPFCGCSKYHMPLSKSQSLGAGGGGGGIGTCSWPFLSVLLALGHSVLKDERKKVKRTLLCLYVYKQDKIYSLQPKTGFRIQNKNWEQGRWEEKTSVFTSWDFIVFIPFVILFWSASLLVICKHKGT